MAIKQINPYVHLDGQAEEAIAHYQRALGAKLEGVMRWSEMPEMPGMPKLPPAEAQKRVMHSSLSVPGGGSVMVSDVPPGHPLARGDNYEIHIEFEDAAELGRCYDALAAGGQQTMPPHDAFWGSRFAMCTDRFGIRWNMTAPLKK